MIKNNYRISISGLLFVFVIALLGDTCLSAYAQNNESSRSSSIAQTKLKTIRIDQTQGHRSHCDPLIDEEPSLSNIYTGKLSAPELGFIGPVTLTINDNKYRLEGDNLILTGTLSAVTTCNYTAVALRVEKSNLEPIAPGQPVEGPPTTFSLRAIRVNDQLQLMSVSNEFHAFKFESFLPPEVTVTTTPSGGVIEVIPKSDFESLPTTDETKWPWRSISGKARLSGVYHYRVSWPDGTVKEGEKRVESINVIFP
jgi:hypothetical protein